MRHARKDYNRRIQDSENLIPDSEPVFLIRGQDKVGAEAVRAWAHLHRLNGGSDVACEMAIRQSYLMEAWPNKKGADVDPKLDATRQSDESKTVQANHS